MFKLDRLLSKKNSVVGIDISSASVKMMQLSKKEEHYTVQAAGFTQIPAGAIIDKEIKEPELLIETISNALRLSRVNANQAILALPDSAVISKVITLDAGMSEDEMETQITFEADKYIPYPINEVSLDFCVIGGSEKESAKVEVLLAAAKTSVVDSRVDVIREIGLKPLVVDVESFAIERAMHTLSQKIKAVSQDRLIGIMDLGARMMSLTVLEDYATVFTREEDFSGYELICALQEKYEKTQHEAYQIIMSGKWPDGFEQDILEPFKQATLIHIKRAIQFFASTSQHSELDVLVLAGGIAMLPGLINLVEKTVGIKTMIANPFIDLSFKTSVNKELLLQQGPTFMTCYGLALRAFDL